MKTMTFKIFGVDFSSVVNPKTYETWEEPVIAWEAAALDGSTRRVISRWRRGVRFRTHTMYREALKNMRKAISDGGGFTSSDGSVSITYTVLQTGETVTVRMRLSELSARWILTDPRVINSDRVEVPFEFLEP